MKIILALGLLCFSTIATSQTTRCDHQSVGISFLGSKTINFLAAAIKYQNFDFEEIKKASEMKSILKKKELIEKMHKLYSADVYIWGQEYKKMLSRCSSKEKKELFAKAFTVYEALYYQRDTTKKFDSLEYIAEYELGMQEGSRIFNIKSYEHFLSIFTEAIKNIDANRSTMLESIKREKKIKTNELNSLQKESTEMDKLISEEERLYESRRKAKETLEQKQKVLERLKNNTPEPISDNSTTSNNPRTVDLSNSTGNRVIKENSIICQSEDAFNRQMDALAQNDLRLFQGCTVNDKSIKAWFENIRMLSGTCTLWDSNRTKKLWVSCESLAK